MVTGGALAQTLRQLLGHVLHRQRHGHGSIVDLFWVQDESAAVLASILPLDAADMRPAKLFRRIGNGNLANIAFRDFTRLLAHLGFRRVRVAGSHQVFGHPAVPELVNLQDVAGTAKPYQVRQVWTLVQRYNLKLGDGS